MVSQSMSGEKAGDSSSRLWTRPSRLGVPLTHLATSALREQPRSWDVPPAFDGAALRTMLASTYKLREVALLSEILQPPLALRRTRRFGKSRSAVSGQRSGTQKMKRRFPELPVGNSQRIKLTAEPDRYWQAGWVFGPIHFLRRRWESSR